MLPNDFNKRLDAYIEKITPKRKRELSLEEQKFIKDLLGYPGSMLSGSKRAPKTKGKGEHLCVWNSNIIVEGFDKVWFGDINITKDENKLKQIARYLKAKVYVLKEMDGRFEYENNPQIQNAVYSTDGLTSTLGNDYLHYYNRDSTNKLYRVDERQ